MQSGRGGEETASARQALQRALADYRHGVRDLKACADQAGLPEWAFLEEAQACPDPVALRLGPDLPPFVRGRPQDE